MRPGLLVSTLGITFALLSAPAALAQTGVVPSDEGVTQERPLGWSFTPGLDYAFVWDSNLTFANDVSDLILEERVHVVQPRGELAFVGRRGGLALGYHGSLIQHVEFGVLNSYEQRLLMNSTRQLSRRSSWFARYAAATSPTTELLEIVGVPFGRVGTRRQDLRTGVQMKLQRETDVTVAYRLEWVDFERDSEFVERLFGGYSHGGALSVKHATNRRLALTGEYDVQRARLINGQNFTLQNATSGVEYALSEGIRAFAAAGVSYLGGVGGASARIGPALRAGLATDIERAAVSLIYSRSYVPSYGFGGTSDNEELTARVQLPLARRVYAATALSLRSNEPLTEGALKLRSTWFSGSVGYRLANWVQLEAFTSGTLQRTDRPGGRLNRYRVGLQLSTATTTRIR